MMVDNDCGCIPVVDSEAQKKPIGMITDRDITMRTVAEGKNPLDLTAADAMSNDAVTVTPDTSVEDCSKSSLFRFWQASYRRNSNHGRVTSGLH